MVERYTEAHGVKKGHLIEEALLHHLQALRELPADIIIPPRIIVDEQTAKTLQERVENPRNPTKAMKSSSLRIDGVSRTREHRRSPATAGGRSRGIPVRQHRSRPLLSEVRRSESVPASHRDDLCCR